ncbi:hypothetical protein [Cryobacterium sp. M25]|uniref:hypothetical protein n=1 Tax=Cryobacterium sp. M25 TaxID=2048293 RepID=UPI000CE2E0B0|nr:hypothetical protein [Cryobacterium sp. M25]
MSRTDSDDSFAEFAGTVIWPRSAAELTDTTRCPACRALLHSSVCSSCGLDLRHPAAVQVLTASTDAAASLDRRRELIGRIRFDLAEARTAAQRLADSAAAATAALSTPVAPATPVTPPRLAIPPAAPTAPTLTPPRPPAGARPPAPESVPAAPRRSSVQVLLLLVGVTLVSVAAIFFLTVAWIFAGLEARSAIIALFTVAALVTSGVLRRRRLVARRRESACSPWCSCSSTPGRCVRTTCSVSPPRTARPTGASR